MSNVKTSMHSTTNHPPPHTKAKFDDHIVYPMIAVEFEKRGVREAWCLFYIFRKRLYQNKEGGLKIGVVYVYVR